MKIIKKIKIIQNYSDVVIGSRTVTESKFQVLNFMNLIYDCIVNEKDHNSMGYSNLRPRLDNLTYEIARLVKNEEISKIYYYDINKHIYNLIEAIRVNLETSSSNETRKLCIEIWKNLLKELTKLFDLKYTLKYKN
jgi:acetylglutamate synthase